MKARLERRVMLVAMAASGLTMTSCTDDADKARLEAAVDSMTSQRDSTIARMDSAGVVNDDTTHRDTTGRVPPRDTVEPRPAP